MEYTSNSPQETFALGKRLGEQAKPGDIVFFDGTMGEDVAGITHCGIYVGNHKMLHCGSPIGYADLTDSYWQTHFHSFGRVPN